MVLRRIGDRFPVVRFRNDLDHIFDDLLSGLTMDRGWLPFGHNVFPAMNIWEDGEALFAEAELPGVKMADIEISVLGKELTIKGERTDPATDEQTYHRRERGKGSFSRVLRLPAEVDVENVEATLRDGVLLVRLPKAAAGRARKIEVKS